MPRIEAAGAPAGSDEGLDLVAEQSRSPVVGLRLGVAQKNFGRAVAEQVVDRVTFSTLLEHRRKVLRGDDVRMIGAARAFEKVRVVRFLVGAEENLEFVAKEETRA